MLPFTSISIPINPNYEQLEELQEQIQAQYPQLKKDFNKFKELVNPLLVNIEDNFKSDLDSDPVSLDEELRTLIQYSFTAGQYLVWAAGFLQLFEMLYFYPKQQKLSEGDRKQYVSLKTLEQNSILQLLQKYEEKVDKKITTIQSRLKREHEKEKKYGSGEF